jgi:osmotically-inducible protein OsmY
MKTTTALAASLALLLGTTACQDRSVTSDAELSEQVRNRIEADRDLAAYDLDVSADDGVVTLSGSVARADQRDAAEQLARDVAGVGGVVNRLDVAAPGDVGAPGMPPAAPDEG